MNQNHVRKGGRMIFLIAAVMLIFTATALAVTYHEDFFHSAYGTAVNDQAPYTVEVYDEDKQRFHTEVCYGVERVEADAETAERLLGECITPLGLSAELEGYTFTVHDIALDQNGIGAVTIDVKNPAGHGLRRDGTYSALDGECPPFYLCFECGDDLIGSSEIIADEGFSETSARVISYVSPFHSLDLTGTFTLSLGVYRESHSDPATTQIIIPAVPRVPAQTLKSESIEAELSPLGVCLSFLEASANPESDICFGEELPEETSLMEDVCVPEGYFAAVPSKLVILFEDGTAFTAYDDETLIMNVMHASSDESHGSFWMAFNRIVDVDSVTGIVLGYTDIRAESFAEKEALLIR